MNQIHISLNINEQTRKKMARCIILKYPSIRCRIAVYSAYLIINLFFIYQVFISWYSSPLKKYASAFIALALWITLVRLGGLFTTFVKRQKVLSEQMLTYPSLYRVTFDFEKMNLCIKSKDQDIDLCYTYSELSNVKCNKKRILILPPAEYTSCIPIIVEKKYMEMKDWQFLVSKFADS